MNAPPPPMNVSTDMTIMFVCVRDNPPPPPPPDNGNIIICLSMMMRYLSRSIMSKILQIYFIIFIRAGGRKGG